MSLLEKYSFGEIGRGMHASRNKGFWLYVAWLIFNIYVEGNVINKWSM
jgi:hypothetical protein